MENLIVYNAYIDESGDPNFNDGASKTFFICATIVKNDVIESVTANVSDIKNRFGLPELKSSKSSNDERRKEILNAISKLDIKIITIFVKKDSLSGDWFNYRKSFYKYIQRLLITEVFRLFGIVNLTFDSYGKPDYQESFLNYMTHIVLENLQTELFYPNVSMSTPKNESLIQLSDFVGGSLRKYYEGTFAQADTVLKSIWAGKLCVNHRYFIDLKNTYSDVVDRTITKCALDSTFLYLENNRIDEKNHAICETLEFLQYSLYENPQKFCCRDEIRVWLAYRGYEYTKENISRQIISELRSAGVMLSSSGVGIKIPVNLKEIKDHYNFILGQTIPSLKRLKKIHQVICARVEKNELKNLLDPEYDRILNLLTDYK